MKRIELKTAKGVSQGFALVDDKDFRALDMMGRWYLTGKGYVACGVTCKGRTRTLLMQREVLALHGVKPGRRTNHRNEDKLDNRFANLRLATFSQIGANTLCRGRGKLLKGVIELPSGRYGAQISPKRAHKWLGSFHTKEEAARAYDAAAIEHFGEFAYLNFPPSNPA